MLWGSFTHEHLDAFSRGGLGTTGGVYTVECSLWIRTLSLETQPFAEGGSGAQHTCSPVPHTFLFCHIFPQQTLRMLDPTKDTSLGLMGKMVNSTCVGEMRRVGSFRAGSLAAAHCA